MSLKEKKEQNAAAINESARRLDELSRDIILNPDDDKLHGRFVEAYNSAIKGGLKEKDVLPMTWEFAQNFMSNQAGTLKEIRLANKYKLTSEGYPQQVINRQLASIGQKVKKEKGLTAAPPIQYQLVGNSGGTTTSTQQPENPSAQTSQPVPKQPLQPLVGNSGGTTTSTQQPENPSAQTSQSVPQPTPQPQPKPTRYTPSVQSMNGIKVSKLPTHTDAYEERKTVTNQPSVETKTTQFGLPDAQTQEYIRKNIIEPTQKAYGVNPNTGDITPFQALGYNPEDERKRREAEMALNDRKRKENAWYNAFAVVGDALTAGLGGNVWKRQPNRIGQQAIADNQRLIAEQKAEDEGNAAKLRNAGTAYANTVNRLIQNYLSKTTTTNKTGGDRVETTIHPEQNGYKYVSNVERENNDGGGSGGGKRGGGSGSWKNNAIYQIGLKHNGKVQYRDITGQQAKNIVEHAETLYEKALRNGDDATRKAILDLLGTNIVREDKDGNYVWNDEALLRSGYIFEADKVFPNGILQGVDESIRDYYRRITGDETDYNETPTWDLVTPAVRQAAENKNRNLKAPWLQLQTNNSNKAPWLK